MKKKLRRFSITYSSPEVGQVILDFLHKHGYSWSGGIDVDNHALVSKSIGYNTALWHNLANPKESSWGRHFNADRELADFIKYISEPILNIVLPLRDTEVVVSPEENVKIGNTVISFHDFEKVAKAVAKMRNLVE